MASSFRCACGQTVEAAEIFASGQAECPACGRAIDVTAQFGPETTVATAAGAPAASISSAEPTPIIRRMFDSLLDERSIYWMLLIGGGLCVLGLIVWLVSLGVFKDPHVLAAALGVGTLAILGAGWFAALRTRFRVAGQALTFLGCVVAPLNLWFYHAQNLITVDGHLWVGGVACCLLYAATVVVLRDPLFMVACEAGVTLTTLLLLADMGRITDATLLSLFLMALGLASIHAERAFSPAEGSAFPRRRFGLPLFWSGHVQVGASLAILLGSQLLGWFVEPARAMFGFEWAGNLLTENHLLAAALWLAGVYVYLYSDVVVRKVGVYLGLAGFALVMAEVTLLLGFEVEAEWIIAAMAVTAAGINVAHSQWAGAYKKLDRVVPPLAWVLSVLPVLWGIALHLRAVSRAAAEFDWAYATTWELAAVMLVTAIANRVSAHLCRQSDPKSSGAYVFLSATSLLVAAAGMLRVLGLVAWSEQAPWMMLVPLGYLAASRIERSHYAERALYAVAHTSIGVILLHVLFALSGDFRALAPIESQRSTLMLSFVLAEAAAFYFLAGLVRGGSANVYLGAAAACGALWQFMGYAGIDPSYYTMLYAVLGVVCVAAGRLLGLEPAAANGERGSEFVMLRGRGAAAFHSGNGILTIACLAALLQGLSALAHDGSWLDLAALALTAAAAGLAAIIAPAPPWRRFYVTAAVALAAVAALQFNALIELSGWQKLEIFCTVAGVGMLAASHFARFREDQRERDASVSLGLEFGSLLTALPLLTAVLYHRWMGDGPSKPDEMSLLTVTILMLVTGLSWQIRSTTLLGGGSLALYLIVLVASLAYHPQVEIGVYMAVGGGLVFAAGIALSVYRDKLLELPEYVAKREGVFRILNWR